MSNQQLIKSAHIWFLALLLGCGVWAMSGKAEVNPQDQNSNQNSNSNANANSSRSQNRNANRSANRNTGATGEQPRTYWVHGVGDGSSEHQDASRGRRGPSAARPALATSTRN